MRRHLTPSLAVSMIALFVALGGSSYAAVTLHKNSVTSTTIRDGSIRLADLNKSIRPQKSNRLFRSAVVDTITDPTSGVHINVQSEPGIVGPAGPAGGAGPSGTATVTTREAVSPDITSGGQGGATASCLPGEKVMGGGASYVATGQVQQVAAIPTYSRPSGENWTAAYTNTTQVPSTMQVHVFALCAAA